MLNLCSYSAMILGLISLPGLLINLYVLFKLSTRKPPFSGFQKLCIMKSVPNSIVCFTFLVWSTPLCIIHPTYESVPRSVNVGFGQVAGWGAYILGPLIQVCMSFNRFYVLYFPMSSIKASNFPFTNTAIFLALCIAVVYTVIGFPDKCGFVFDPEVLSWRPEEFDCALWLADFIFYSILILSITSNSLNFATFLKLVSSRVEGVSSGDSSTRRKRRISMYIQSVLQDTLHLIDMINCTILFKLNSAIWYQFIFLSVSFLSIHALDGSVMLYFHTEIHPQWCRRLLKPKSRTGTIFVNRSKISSFHPSD
ncbi:7TM GPCR serpentine receptor class x (Srx) domain-containing protein [Caenorhabditis elegans]|uniref:7TM GPCR serpentine receptor class x (Srx) domain-containing protein n=3 Tax=Caenorhabditis elegans TaxID=6239 RepID=G5ECS6_CAEEL|nr:7TM GPCR serpentine receptor class x (Srx) domain-containing protein [Caenorhabditis elegans]CAB04254.2 7TM GPCR serpentine receptor class x (Srx) domain-containing protein [Caenorhabditis elegans]|eukprot:NP_001041110.1 Serpentine Receptor, class X [Caenorhabditis elegans]